MCETVGVFDFWQGNSRNSRVDTMRDLCGSGKKLKNFLDVHYNFFDI